MENLALYLYCAEIVSKLNVFFNICSFISAIVIAFNSLHHAITATYSNKKADVSFSRVSQENHPCPQQTLCHGFQKLHLR